MKCPHCRTAYNVQWTQKNVGSDRDVAGRYIHWTMCPECGRTIIVLLTQQVVDGDIANQFVYPKAAARQIPTDVPDPYASDFREACLVVADSPKASAALSRRCLQHLIREKAGIKRKSLDAEITELLDSHQLPTHLAENVDAVRNVGNFAAHPIKSTNTGAIVEVEDNEAEWLLDVLEGLFDFYFVQPQRSKAKRDALDKKLKDTGKPQLKSVPAAQAAATTK